MKPFYAVAALAVFSIACLSYAHADDASAPVGKNCELGEVANLSILSAEQMTESSALFSALCTKLGGALIYSQDRRWASRVTHPGTLLNTRLQDFYPLDAIRLRQTGTVILAYVLNIEGRVVWVHVLKSTGYPALDEAAEKFLGGNKFKSPAYLDSKAVNYYTIMPIRWVIG